MAENLSRSLSGTKLVDSEEDFDIFCDFCNAEEQKRMKAVVFCIHCMEHLCKECEKNHKKTSATKNHIFQDMSQQAASCEKKSQSPRSLDVMSDRCPKHPEKQIEFFCSRHQQLVCITCVPPHYKTCDDNVLYIPDNSGNVTQSDELRNTLAELKKLIATLEANQSRAKWCQQQMEESYDQLIVDIKQFRQTINQHIDKLTVELFLKASKLKGEIIQSGTSQMPACDVLIDEIKGIQCDVDKKCGLKQNSQVFIALKSIKEKIQTWETEADKISKSAQASRFVFHRDAKLVEVTTVARLGTVSVNEPSSAKPTLLQNINIKLATDKKDCNITGIAVLAGGGLVVTDHYNQSVKLVDTAGCKVTESVSLTSAPLDITVVGGDQLAVTLSGHKHLQMLNLSPKLSLSHTLPVPGCYNGITYSGGNFILACYRPVASVHICDRSGQLLQQIDTDNTGRKLFTNVSYVAVSPDQSTIYISDPGANKVVCLNHAGVVMATYSNARLGPSRPSGAAVDDWGRVLLCSYDDQSLHLLDREGRLVKVLLEEEDGLVFPRTVAHSYSTIYISSASKNPAYRNSIKAFTLGQ